MKNNNQTCERLLTRHQLEKKIGELQASLYWHERGTFPVSDYNQVKTDLEKLEEDLKAGRFKEEINEKGNIVERSFRRGDRYHFDFKECHPSKGWKQYDTDQDAWYFGMWVHVEKRQILTYAEGDITLVKCPITESFKAELKAMADFYGPPPPAFTVIDMNGTVTRIYDKRPEVSGKENSDGESEHEDQRKLGIG